MSKPNSKIFSVEVTTITETFSHSLRHESESSYITVNFGPSMLDDRLAGVVEIETTIVNDDGSINRSICAYIQPIKVDVIYETEGE